MTKPAALSLQLPPDFDLRAIIAAHGWYQLAPFRWLESEGALGCVLRTVSSRPLPVLLKPAARGRCRILPGRPLGPRLRARARQCLTYMLALDVPLHDFLAHCRRHADLRWIARKKLGRFLRGEDVFEDMVKTLLTTNCTWRQTVSMVARLVDLLGAPGTGGTQAFPSPEAVLSAGRAGLEQRVRTGYRSRALLELAEVARAGGLEGLRSLDSEQQERALLGFRGFGPYAASSLRMLWGHFERPVVDSWALARAREVHGGGREVKPQRLRAIYAQHGPWAGLVQWFDLDRERYQHFPPDWLA